MIAADPNLRHSEPQEESSGLSWLHRTTAGSFKTN